VTDIWGVITQRKPIDSEAFDLMLQLGELFRDPRASEQLGERARVLVAQPQHALERVAVVRVGEVQLLVPESVRYQSDALSLLGGEFVAHPDTR